jgi:hypothetical protein
LIFGWRYNIVSQSNIFKLFKGVLGIFWFKGVLGIFWFKGVLGIFWHGFRGNGCIDETSSKD